MYDANGELRKEYYLLDNREMARCQLKVNSFIDCSKSYKIDISNIDITKLALRSIPQDIRVNIIDKIKELKSIGIHTQYAISKSQFLSLNTKLKYK